MFSVSLLVTRKQKPIVDGQNIKSRESEHLTIENHQFTKGTSKRGRKKQRKYKRIGKQKIGTILPVNNYLKWK